VISRPGYTPNRCEKWRCCGSCSSKSCAHSWSWPRSRPDRGSVARVPASHARGTTRRCRARWTLRSCW
jgi:hypothetical protein